MTGHATVPAGLAELMHGPAVPGASCRGVAPDWDTRIAGEDTSAGHARVQLARRVCRRCPGLARCLELLDELDRGGQQPTEVVIAGEIRGPHGEVLTPRWSLRDAVDGGRGVRITDAETTDTAPLTPRTPSHNPHRGG